MKRPAVLGGPPAFSSGLPFARPMTPPFDRVTARLRPSYERGMLTDGPLVRTLEEKVAERLGVRHVVAVASCTSGLMLVLRALAPTGSVLVPSFTFSASAHAIAWCGLRPVFVDCHPQTFHLDPADASARLAVSQAGAIMATHVFGAPCEVGQIEALSHDPPSHDGGGGLGGNDSGGLPVLFDAAHALGATCGGRAVGSFGDAEVFSLSPTKLVVGGEGGLVTTNRDDIAERVRLGRNYGNPGNYDTQLIGLNGRMSELHAALALESLAQLDEQLELRAGLAGRYLAGLADLPGIAGQVINTGDRSTYKDLTITVDQNRFGMQRDVLVRALRAEGVDTRCYYCPPVHHQRTYASASEYLPVTDLVAERVVSLPMFADLAPPAVDGVVEAIVSLHMHAEEVTAAVTAA